MDRCFFFVLFIRLFFFLFFGKFVSAAHRGHPLGPPFFFSPSLFSFLSLHIFSAFFPFLFVAVHWIFSSVAFLREILLMFIAGSTYAEPNASTGRPVNCPMKINMVLFFFFCRHRSEASTLQRTEQNYVLSSSRLSLYHRLASLGHKSSLKVQLV